MEQSNLVGRTLGGRYKIDDLIGQGGMGTVYKAHDPNLKRVVAVKTIREEFAEDPKFLSRFESEAVVVAKLRHPNIVQVLDYSHDDGLYYMVQEFVPGETLQARLQRLDEAGRPLRIDEAIRYTLDLCDALRYAHQRGTIHRDVKPANIMIDVHGHAILMDFGIVKITDSMEHSVAGAVVGTALYMPPELIQGEAPDARSDIYSLGVTLYEMVSGQPPFVADSAMTVLMMHIQDPVPNPCKLRAEVPAPLCDIIDKALAKDRDARYGSADALAADLRDLVELIEAGAVLLQATQLDESVTAGPPLGATVEESRAAAVDSHLDMVPAGQPLTDPEAAMASPEKSLTPGQSGILAGSPEAAGRPGQRWLKLGGAALLGVVLLGLALFLLLGSDTDGSEESSLAGALTSPTVAAVLGDSSATALVTVDDIPANLPAAPAPTGTNLPAAPAPTPAELAPSSHNSALSPTLEPVEITITDISLDRELNYVVAYETLGLAEIMTSTHLHFFWDTVPFEEAGAPAESAWIRHFGPSPFSGYAAADRPENASQLCVQAAHPNHTPLLGSGDCALLPDVVTVTTDQDLDCLFGPGREYPGVGQLAASELTLVRGLSFNELWWYVVNPSNLEEVCWLSTLDTKVSGDISQLPSVEGPSAGVEPPQPLSVEISGISIDAENHYLVEHVTEGFTPAFPGTHVHFYFNTFAPQEVGTGGEANRRAYSGPSPFDGYITDDRPSGATEMCAIVANPDHSVVLGSGNCYPLPGLPTVKITEIAEGGDGQYVVDFEAKDFVPEYPGGYHIHFFFNVFEPEDVSIGGSGSRLPYGGPPPFTGYLLADRPPEATQLCAIVANPDHSILPGSGSCATLPGLPTVEITGISLDEEGQYVVDHVATGFTPEYPGGYHMHFFFDIYTPEDVGMGGDANRLSHGSLSPFSGYAATDRPEGATRLCVVVATPLHSVVPNSGNCFPLPDVLLVEITQITVDEANRYVVTYETLGFTPEWPGTHVHFYFDTISPADLGSDGGSTNYSHGGHSPYTGYSTADRPPEATQLCAIAVQEDNSIVAGSGSCFPLPDASGL